MHTLQSNKICKFNQLSDSYIILPNISNSNNRPYKHDTLYCICANKNNLVYASSYSEFINLFKTVSIKR
jgi:hypothetical protein